MPEGACGGVPFVYSNFSPGRITGCSPTTPSPRVSWVRPKLSVMRQKRERICTVSTPLFSISTL